jgi:thiol-disulfide isomerase/thioredoxin
VLALWSFRSGRAAWAVRSLAVTILVAAAWLVGVQAWVFGHFCKICCAVHALAASGSLLLLAREARAGFTHLGRLLPVATAVVTLTALALGSPLVLRHREQPVFVSQAAASARFVERGTGTELKFLGGQMTLDARSLPRIGNLDARHVVVAVMTHSCSHCIRMVRHLQEVVDELPGNELVVFLMPVVIKPNVAEAQGLLAAVWAANEKVHNQILQRLAKGEIPLTAAAIRDEATRLLPGDVADKCFAPDALAAARLVLAKNGAVAGRAAQSSGLRELPQLWFPDGAQMGAAEDVTFYHETFARRLGIQRRHAPQVAVKDHDLTLGNTPTSGLLMHDTPKAGP